jgi:hypothetical protein
MVSYWPRLSRPPKPSKKRAQQQKPRATSKQKDLLNQNSKAVKTLFGAIIVDGRNKINGFVASKNRYGSYLRTKVTPVNPQTTRQQLFRNMLATNSQAWRGLTESQRQSWIDGASNFPQTDIFGNTKILSGQALFVKLNNNLFIGGGAPLDTCPSPVALPILGEVTVTADDSANTVIITGVTDPVPADTAMIVFATPNVTPGRSFVKNQFRFVTTFNPAAAAPFDISTAWTALFGDPVIGNKVFVKCFYISRVTGQATVPAQGQTIVVA